MRSNSIQHVRTNIYHEAAIPGNKAKKRGNSPTNTSNELDIEDDVIIAHNSKNKQHKAYEQYDQTPEIIQNPEDESLVAAAKDEGSFETKETEAPSENGQGVSAQSACSAISITYAGIEIYAFAQPG